MNAFQSPEEAIKAFVETSEKAWAEYVSENKLDPNADPKAFGVAKHVFLSGYKAGARFVTESIVRKMMPDPTKS